MFTTVTVHNCGVSASLLLSAAASYPAPGYYPKDNTRHVPSSWDCQKHSPSHGHLEVTLLERISEGRMGVVYCARVEKATTGEGVDITSSLPATLCLKFAKQHHCRSLARESWFYEQLHEWHGISVPNYYGFYTLNDNEQGLSVDNFQPWTDLRTPSAICPEFERDLELASKYRSMDWLPDDAPRMSKYLSPSNYRSKSPWFEWNLDVGNPDIALLIMENLGQACATVWPSHEPGDAFKCIWADILNILDDVAGNGLGHSDVTAWNLLQYNGPDTNERRCPRHGVVHKWRLIDFDRSCMFDLANTTRDGKYMTEAGKKCVGNPLIFWGEFLG